MTYVFPISGDEFPHVFFFSMSGGEFQARQEALRRRVVDGSDELRVLKDAGNRWMISGKVL